MVGTYMSKFSLTDSSIYEARIKFQQGNELQRNATFVSIPTELTITQYKNIKF